MCFFDSPVGRCEAVGEMVLLDETQAECACEHGCPPGFACPLAGYFAEVSGVSEDNLEALKQTCKRRKAPNAPKAHAHETAHARVRAAA